MTETSTCTVLVTGFGPFGNHQVNASWQAVQLLPPLFRESNINLIVHEIPVDYKFVCDKIPEFWQTYKPQLVIHVGVSEFCQQFTLESIAHNTGYCRNDINGFQMENHSEINEQFQTRINLENVVSKLKQMNINASISSDCGRYLCEFIYYQSLSINDARSLFVHVPPLDQPFTAEQLSNGLKNIIEIIIEELQI